MVAAMSLVAIDDTSEEYELNKNACGRIVWWTLSGETSVETLADRLIAQGASVAPPERPSPMVALHRAVDDAARAAGATCRPLGRGAWAIASKAREETNEDGSATARLVSDVLSRARIEGDDRIRAEGEHAESIEDFFERARRYLSSQDMSGWLCDAIAALGAVSLRESGGFYFVPKDAVERWERIVCAVHESSGHKFMNVPALKSKDALNAILAAVTADTQKACADMVKDLATLGGRGLRTREDELRGLADRAGRYEAILGTKLDVLRAAIAETQAGVTAAIFALASQSDAE